MTPTTKTPRLVKIAVTAAALILLALTGAGCGKQAAPPEAGAAGTQENSSSQEQFHEYEGDTGTFRDWLFADMYYEAIWGEDYFLPYTLSDTEKAEPDGTPVEPADTGESKPPEETGAADKPKPPEETKEQKDSKEPKTPEAQPSSPNSEMMFKMTKRQLRKAPYIIHIEGLQVLERMESNMIIREEMSVKIDGQKKNDKLGGSGWMFTVVADYTVTGTVMPVAGMKLDISVGQAAWIFGLAEDVALKDMEPKKKDPAMRWTPPESRYVSPEELRAQFIDPNDPKKGLKLVPVLKYNTKFGVETVFRTYIPAGREGFLSAYAAPEEDPSQFISGDFGFRPGETTGSEKMTVTIDIDSMDFAEAYIEIGASKFGPFGGLLTSETEIETKLSGKESYPIWGTWTDKPKAAVPDIFEDQKKLKEDGKPLEYTEGRWLTLIKGGKGEPSTYVFVQVLEDKILYEAGELWPYNKTFELHPTTMLTFPRDLSGDGVEGHAIFMDPSMLYLTYNKDTDRLFVTGSGFFQEWLERAKK